MTEAPNLREIIQKPFGTVYADKMSIAWFKDGAWSDYRIQAFQPLSVSPATHVFHYGSAVFEGLKVHLHEDGRAFFFRLSDHVARMRRSAELLCLPVPKADGLEAMIRETVAACRHWVPPQPGALYIRPVLMGTLPSIGAAASPSTEACLFVIASPVGAYFRRGISPLRVLIEDKNMRCAPHFGFAKTGSNYASALPLTMEAKRRYDVDQVLFAPSDDVEETGAANFFMIDEERIITKALDTTFLHGVTRDSLLKLAGRLGYRVEERRIRLEELLQWLPHGETALSGTAAVLAGIGTMIYRGEEIQVGTGEVGPSTLRLRQALRDIQTGQEPDPYGWLSEA